MAAGLALKASIIFTKSDTHSNTPPPTAVLSRRPPKSRYHRRWHLEMSSLSTVESKLPPGFRFHPRDDELICDFLMNWVMGLGHPVPMLIEVDLNKCEPWDIPGIACVGGKEWYFYNQRDRKYATGFRTNRATISGYWKATGKDRPIFRKGSLVGMRKTLVFYQGRAPKGRKNDWVMHEFRLEGAVVPAPKAVASDKEDWVLCRVFSKSKSEISGKQQPSTTVHDGMSPSSPRLPSLMKSYTTVDHPNQTSGITHPYQEQVPCFSIFPATQTNPHSSSIFNTPQNHFGGGGGGGIFMPHLGTYDDYMINNNPNSCNREVINAVLNHITKMESSVDEQQGINETPSFGEGSSDSYLSEFGLSSMWNQYS